MTEKPGVDIRRLLTDHRILRGGQRLPTPAGCHKLALLINDLDSAFVSWMVDLFMEDDVRSERIAAALETLSELLPDARQRLVVDHIAEDVAILDRLADAAGTARLRPWASRPAPRVHRWHQFVGQLAEAFIDAMRTTNPDLEIGQSSNTGPLPRFLEAAIPLITSERPKAAAIVRHLTRQRQKAAKGGVTAQARLVTPSPG